jgi:hypothetical protein
LDMLILKDDADLGKLGILDLPSDMKLEIAPGLNIGPKTVGDLLRLTRLPRPLRLQVPRPRYPESTVKVEPGDA